MSSSFIRADSLNRGFSSGWREGNRRWKSWLGSTCNFYRKQVSSSLWLCLTSHFSALCSSHPFLAPFWAETVAQLSWPASNITQQWYLKCCWLKRGAKIDPENSFLEVILGLDFVTCHTIPVAFPSPAPSGRAGWLPGSCWWMGCSCMPPMFQLELLEGRNCSWFHHPWKAWDLHPVLHLCVQGLHARCQTPCWGNKKYTEHQQLPSHCRESGRSNDLIPRQDELFALCPQRTPWIYTCWWWLFKPDLFPAGLSVQNACLQLWESTHLWCSYILIYGMNEWITVWPVLWEKYEGLC